MKKIIRSAFALALCILLSAVLYSCKGGEGDVTTVDGNHLSPKPQELTLSWEKGYVGSFENIGDGKTLSGLAYSGAFVEDEESGFYTSEIVRLDGKGITLSVSGIEAIPEGKENVFVISHWSDNKDGTYSLDRRAPQFKPCDYVIATDGSYSYTTSADVEYVRICVFVGQAEAAAVSVCNGGSDATTAKLDTPYTLPESGQGIATDVLLLPGSVGSINNTKGYKLSLDYSDTEFKTTQNIVIPQKGTTITYTVSGEYSYDVASLTSWYLAEDGLYKNNTGSSNYNAIVTGKDGIQRVNGGKSHEFEYTTSFDNEIIRLCVPAENQSLSITYKVDENYFKGSFDRLHTEMPGKMTYITDTLWLPGYVSSPFTESGKKGLMTLDTVNDSMSVDIGDVFEEHIVSEAIHIPKAGTQVIVMVANPARDDIAVLSSYGADGKSVDYSKATFVGNPASGNTVFETYNEKSDMSVYKYITSDDNEYIRFTMQKSRTSYVPVIAIKEIGSGAKGTWENAFPDYDEYFRGSLENSKGLVSENIKPIDVSWNRGYVTSSGSINAGKDGFLYSDVIHLEKAGTVIYFMDTAKIGSDAYTYLGTEGYAFSFWDSEGKKIVSPRGIESKDLDTYITSDHNFRVFRYTSRKDNEYVRLSIRASQGSPNIPVIMCPVFIAENTALISEGESEIKISVGDKEYSCRISTYEGYSPDDYSTLLLTDSESAYSLAKGEKLKNTVCAYTNASGQALFEVYAYLTTLYPINGEKTYYVGDSTEISKYTAASLSSEKASADGIKTLVKTQSEGNYYSDILEGLTMYAIGDSYFQGSGLGHYYTWPSEIARKYNMPHINYGIGGSTIANVSTNNPMVIRYTSMQNGDADIIILEGGRNDRNQKVPYGDFDSRDSKTLCGALNIMIEGLHKKYPNALIILVTPWNYKDNSSYVTYNYAMKMVEYQKQLKLDYVSIINAADTSISGVDMNDVSFRELYSKAVGDISHLNSKGMSNVTVRMEKQVAELYAKFKGITINENGQVK